MTVLRKPRICANERLERVLELHRALGGVSLLRRRNRNRAKANKSVRPKVTKPHCVIPRMAACANVPADDSSQIAPSNENGARNVLLSAPARFAWRAQSASSASRGASKVIDNFARGRGLGGLGGSGFWGAPPPPSLARCLFCVYIQANRCHRICNDNCAHQQVVAARKPTLPPACDRTHRLRD